MAPDRAPLAALGPLWLVGCGNMGSALLARWVAAGLSDVAVIDPQPGVLPVGVGARDVPPPGLPPAILVLAVKPQAWAAAVDAIAPRLGPDTLVVSVMAGVRCAAIAAKFGARTVVRTMPNTPARAGQGVTALYAAAASPAQREAADLLMAAAGATVWLGDEDQFDAVTALSGSGPAYVFAFIEALAAAGVAAGLPAPLAATLARQTVTGAAALAATGDPAELRAAVTSPGGTTAAGLAVLTGGDALGRLLRDTVAAARLRSQALGRGE